jgi:polyhydroxyalkanoate synthase subunit PhaC
VPRPLLLHLTLAMLRSTVSRAASLNWKHAWPNSNEAIVAAIRDALAQGEVQGQAEGGAPRGARVGTQRATQDPDGGAPGDAFPGAVLAETLRQDAALIEGIAAYRRHPWRRDMPDPPAIWQEGGSRLLDYGGNGPVVLFVPSLVNRAYVLDLAPGHSMLRWLAGHGVHPLLLDWGWPGEAERRFSMGGTLAVAAAQRRPDLVRALALLAAPWDFHAPDPVRAIQAAEMLPLLEPALAFNHTLPVDLLQGLFALLDPWGVADKYRGFARLDPAGARATLFVALEDWLNDGIPLAAPVTRECLGGWYGANTPARGEWRIAGLPVDPAALRMPAFVAAPGRDRIVPPESSRPLAALIEGAVLLEPTAGHIGMAAGHTAERVLWRPFREWLLAL